MCDSEYALCAYRIVQECLSNIARHAPGCQTACIDIRLESRSLRVRVSNDLAGVAKNRDASSGTGMGLKLLGERVRSLHGKFSVELSAVQFAVQADLPMIAP
jgi:two-component system sensor histidine kinase UhpB